MTKDEYVKRLEEILDEQFKRLDGTTVLPIYNRPTAVGQAITAILALNNEAIGEDEERATVPGEVLFTDRIGYVKIEDVDKLNKGNRNQLRQELRNILGVSNDRT